MVFQNDWDKGQYLAETPKQYIAAGIGWCLEDTGELPDMQNNLLVAYGPNGCDERFIERFGPQSREELEHILSEALMDIVGTLV